MKAKGGSLWRHPGFPQGGKIPCLSGSRARPGRSTIRRGNASGADFLCYCLPQIFKPSGNDVRSGIFRARYGGNCSARKAFSVAEASRWSRTASTSSGLSAAACAMRVSAWRAMFLIKKAPGSKRFPSWIPPGHTARFRFLLQTDGRKAACPSPKHRRGGCGNH